MTFLTEEVYKNSFFASFKMTRERGENINEYSLRQRTFAERRIILLR